MRRSTGGRRLLCVVKLSTTRNMSDRATQSNQERVLGEVMLNNMPKIQPVRLHFNDRNLGVLGGSTISTDFFEDCVLHLLIDFSILGGFGLFVSGPLLLSLELHSEDAGNGSCHSGCELRWDCVDRGRSGDR